MLITETLASNISKYLKDDVLALYKYAPASYLNNAPDYFLLIVKSVQTHALNQLSAYTKKLPATVQLTVFSKDELNTSLDVFPIEFQEMQEDRTLLLGEDLLKDITVEKTHLRHECEYTMRSNILKLRSAILQGDTQYANLIRVSYPIFYSCLKCIFQFKNLTPPKNHTDFLAKLSELTEIHATTLLEISSHNKATLVEFDIYLSTLQAFTEYINEI